MKNIKNDSLHRFKDFEVVTVPRKTVNCIYHYELINGLRTGRAYLYELALNDGYKLWRAFASKDTQNPYYIIARDSKEAKMRFGNVLNFKITSIELCEKEESEKILVEFWRTPNIVLGR